MEVGVRTQISFREYFGRCFQDSAGKRRPGTSTEHCQIEIAVSSVERATKSVAASAAVRIDRNETLAHSLGSPFDVYSQYTDRKARLYDEMVASKEELVEAFGGEINLAAFLEQTHPSIDATDSKPVAVMGPSGSGSVFFTSETSVVADRLIHGRRRWFFMEDAILQRLRREAGSDFAPTSAFGFFEDQYEELKEEFGLKIGGNSGAYVCDQNEGDVILTPVGMYATSLSLEDSISERESLVFDAKRLKESVEVSVWNPLANTYDLCACHKKSTWGELGGWLGADHRSQLERAWESSVTADQEVQLAMKVLLFCTSLEAEDGPPFSDSLCGRSLRPCARRVGSAVKQRGKKVPSWLARYIRRSKSGGVKGEL